ncbi:Transposable element tcb1 transposase [Caligus rogercresseyi]|uniref:Transposable element tcb1 transposase n=1 Tax=Caligus rogercresseyi TaxID=217165 RepID=A0A7T8GR60_CALRO|nr:Transposable element tcb1 transposase [Caligus rogercresseyi]
MLKLLNNNSERIILFGLNYNLRTASPKQKQLSLHLQIHKECKYSLDIAHVAGFMNVLSNCGRKPNKYTDTEMEQTRRDKVIELLCAAIIKLLKYPRRTVYDITKKWEESGMSKRKENKPRSDRICTPTFVAGLKSSIKANPGRHIHPRQEAWDPPVDRIQGHQERLGIQELCPEGQTCAVLAEEECAQLLGFQYLAPQQPRPEPMEVCAPHHNNVASLKASIKSEMNKLDPAEVSTACGRFRRRLEDILEVEGGHIEY